MSNNPVFDKLIDEMKAIHALKEQDYAGGRSPHFNFDFSRSFAANFPNPIDKPYAILIGTKIARLITLLERDVVKPQNESIEDTYKDLANYVLLWASKRLMADRGSLEVQAAAKGMEQAADAYAVPSKDRRLDYAPSFEEHQQRVKVVDSLQKKGISYSLAYDICNMLDGELSKFREELRDIIDCHPDKYPSHQEQRDEPQTCTASYKFRMKDGSYKPINCLSKAGHNGDHNFGL